MTAIISVTTSRPRDGKFQEAMAAYAKAKAILERCGGKVRVVSQMFGTTPMTFSVIVESASWAEFGTLSAAVEADAEFQAFLAAARADPFGDIIQRSVFSELPV